MSVQFKLDIDKVIATILFLASKKIPDLTVGKICKLLFYGEKYHLVQFGRPITGDAYSAMVDGPVPSFAYDILKQIASGNPYALQAKQLASKLAIDRSVPKYPVFAATAAYDSEQLSRSDIDALNIAVDRFGGKSFEELSGLTHRLPAYRNAWSKKGRSDSIPMKFEDFFADDPDALTGAKEEMIENYHLHQTFAKF